MSALTTLWWRLQVIDTCTSSDLGISSDLEKLFQNALHCTGLTHLTLLHRCKPEDCVDEQVSKQVGAFTRSNWTEPGGLTADVRTRCTTVHLRLRNRRLAIVAGGFSTRARSLNIRSQRNLTVSSRLYWRLCPSVERNDGQVSRDVDVRCWTTYSRVTWRLESSGD